MIYDAFICYASREDGRAKRLAYSLRDVGLSVWIDRSARSTTEDGVDEALLPPGSTHRTAIEEAIDSAATLIILDSELWRTRDYCRWELEYATEFQKRVIVLGGGTKAPLPSAVRLPSDDPDPAASAVREGLDVVRAHARLTVCAHLRERGSRRWHAAASGEDAALLGRADLPRLGIGLSAPMERCRELILKRQRRYRRTITSASGLLLAGLAVLALVAILASRSAQRSNNRAQQSANRTEALTEAAFSESATNSFTRLSSAERAVALWQDEATLGALRDGVASLNEGTTIEGLPQSMPEGVAVANDGRSAAVVFRDEALVLVDVTRPTRPRPISSSAMGQPVFSPDGTQLAFVHAGNGAAAIAEVNSGRTGIVPGTSNLVALMFASSGRALAVARNGEVLQFDPTNPQQRAHRVGSVPGPVRAAAITSQTSSGIVSLASLDDAMNLAVGPLGAGPRQWQVHLNVKPGSYSLNWESAHVCHGDLSILTTDTAPGTAEAFAVPYTVTPAGQATPTGSMIHSFGLVCLPDGGALAVDPIQGEESFPLTGLTIPNLTHRANDGISYAVASSEDNGWATAVGSDGTIRVANLATAGRSVKVPSAAVVTPAGLSAVIARDGAIQTIAPTGQEHSLASPPVVGAPVRGAYLDQTLGTVAGIGEELIVIRDGRVAQRVPIRSMINTVRPGQPGRTAVVLLAGGPVLIVALERASPTSEVPIPHDLLRDGGSVSDAVMLSAGRLALASTNGRLDVVAIPGGNELDGRIVAAPGYLTAWSGDGVVALGGPDGTLQVLNANTLAVERSSKVLGEGIEDLESNSTRSLLAAQSRNHVAVVGIPHLFAVGHTEALDGLTSIAFELTGSTLLLGIELDLGFSTEAAVRSWPLCNACAGTPAQLLNAAKHVASDGASSGTIAQFVPVG
jgi:TIR domain